MIPAIGWTDEIRKRYICAVGQPFNVGISIRRATDEAGDGMSPLNESYIIRTPITRGIAGSVLSALIPCDEGTLMFVGTLLVPFRPDADLESPWWLPPDSCPDKPSSPWARDEDEEDLDDEEEEEDDDEEDWDDDEDLDDEFDEDFDEDLDDDDLEDLDDEEDFEEYEDDEDLDEDEDEEEEDESEWKEGDT